MIYIKGHVCIVSDHFAKQYRIGLLFAYEMLLSSQFLQQTGGATVRSSTWGAVYRVGFCNALIVM